MDPMFAVVGLFILGMGKGIFDTEMHRRVQRAERRAEEERRRAEQEREYREALEQHMRDL